MRENTHIAVIDDETSIRRALVRLLSVSGFDAAAYATPQEFLDGESTGSPDCILLGLTPRAANGVDLLQRLAESADSPPIIIVTASNNSDFREYCKAFGPSAWLQKPIDAESLLACIRDTIGRRSGN